MKNSFYKIIMLCVVFLLFFIVLFSFVFTNKKLSSQVSSSVSNVVVKVDNLISIPFSVLSSTQSFLSDLLSTYSENINLKMVVASLENQSILVSNLEEENTSLRSSLGLQERFSEEKVITASVSSRSPVAWLESLTVDAGGNKGVSKSMVATSNGGVVGLVASVSAGSSTVRLLSDSMSDFSLASAISIGNDSYVYGVISNYDKKTKLLEMSQLNSDAELVVGEEVVTSGLDSVTVKNVPIGKVESVSSDQGKKTVYVRPYADFDRISYVTFIGVA